MEDKFITIHGKEYKLRFPNVGEYYRIEALKQSLGKGFYNMLLGNSTKSAQDALDAIDVEATITVMMPDLIQDLKVDSFSKLGLKDYVEIRNVYNTEIVPFLKEIRAILNPL